MFAQQSAGLLLIAYSACVGVGLGVWYDLLVFIRKIFFFKETAPRNVKRRLTANKKGVYAIMYNTENAKITVADTVCFLTDLLFWIISALVVIIFIFHLNYGTMRAFMLFSALAGFTAYRLTVGKVVMLFLDRIVLITKKILKRIISLLISPIKKAIRKAVSPLVYSLRKKYRKLKARKILAVMERTETIRRAKRIKNNERDQSRGLN